MYIQYQYVQLEQIQFIHKLQWKWLLKLMQQICNLGQYTVL